MKKISKKLENMKLNRKFTITILIFVMIPMGVILGVLFYNMEQSTIKEHRTYMKNKMERNKTQMETGMPRVNIFFGSALVSSSYTANTEAGGVSLEPRP